MIFGKSYSAILLFSSLILSFAIATPIQPRALLIPLPPAEPPKPAGDGSGPWNSKPNDWRDQLQKTKFQAVAGTADTLGLNNAARGMRHYLDNTGTDLYVTPQSMMTGLPGLRSAVQSLVQIEAVAAYLGIFTTAGEKSFVTTWKQYYAAKAESFDWYFAIGGFSYSVSGVVTKTPTGGSLQYKVHIFDRYNWDGGKSVDIGPFHFEDTELGDLHLKGLAKEYTVRGSSQVNLVNNFKLGTVVPPPNI